MLKIIEVHPSANPQGEYVVLQNQGLVTVNLRGWAVCTEDYLEGNTHEAVAGMYIFREEIVVKPYARVVLFTGCGDAGWVPTVDGKQAYCAYWGRTQTVWKRSQVVHVLQMAASRKVAPLFSETLTVQAPAYPNRTEREDKAPVKTEAGPVYAVARTQ